MYDNLCHKLLLNSKNINKSVREVLCPLLAAYFHSESGKFFANFLERKLELSFFSFLSFFFLSPPERKRKEQKKKKEAVKPTYQVSLVPESVTHFIS